MGVQTVTHTTHTKAPLLPLRYRGSPPLFSSNRPFTQTPLFIKLAPVLLLRDCFLVNRIQMKCKWFSAVSLAHFTQLLSPAPSSSLTSVVTTSSRTSRESKSKPGTSWYLLGTSWLTLVSASSLSAPFYFSCSFQTCTFTFDPSQKRLCPFFSCLGISLLVTWNDD